VIACDGVNSFCAKEAGLYTAPAAEQAAHTTLGVKEVLALPRRVIEERFGLAGREGADFEILGGTGGVAGGGFLYTNLDSVAVGVVLHLPGLVASKRRPEELVADLKAHPAIAPLVADGELVEYSAHLIPEGGYDHLPELAGDGILVAGDAAGLCLAAGIWLEGVNFAMGSGMAAGETAAEALRRGDVSAAGLASYRRRLEESFVLADHRKLRRAPGLILGERMQQRYPQVVCNLVEELFTVRNPTAKPGGVRVAQRELRRAGVRLRDVARDAWTTLRTYG
jgi:electron transfer flavoprotein-quinone oxidoreductase